MTIRSPTWLCRGCRVFRESDNTSSGIGGYLTHSGYFAGGVLIEAGHEGIGKALQLTEQAVSGKSCPAISKPPSRAKMCSPGLTSWNGFKGTIGV